MSEPQPRSSAWLVGCVSPGDEFAVARRMRKSGVRVRVPAGIVAVRVRGERKRKRRAKALYSGYVFFDRSSVADLDDICMRVKGFWYVVAFGEDYAECDDAALLKAIKYARELSRREAPRESPTVRLGAVVKVWGGAFGGYMGAVEAVKGGSALLSGYDFRIPSWMPIDQLIVQQTA